MSDYEALVEQAQDAQAAADEAFADLVEQFEGQALRWAYAALGDFALAQDAAQDAFVTAYQKLDQLREPKAFPAWLRRIVISQCHRLTRNRALPADPLDDTDIPTRIGDPAAAAEEGELRQWVHEAVRELPANDREVIELYYLTGYSQDEMAVMLDVPLTTVKKRLQYARERLRVALPTLEGPLAALGGLDALLPQWASEVEVDTLLFGYAAVPSYSIPVAVGASFGFDDSFELEWRPFR
jgi:RNA polymerase sigma factor (sigma-70 family)